jgi:hypothetical protein
VGIDCRHTYRLHPRPDGHVRIPTAPSEAGRRMVTSFKPSRGLRLPGSHRLHKHHTRSRPAIERKRTAGTEASIPRQKQPPDHVPSPRAQALADLTKR